MSLTLKSDCDNDCSEYAFLNITSSKFSFPTAGALYVNFYNLIIDRKTVNGPYMVYATDDASESSICPQLDFLNLIEIKKKAKFKVENSTFQNIRYNVRHVISAEGTINLYNTNFTNINTFFCPGWFSVIMLSCSSSCYSSSFIYESGYVSLKNGYFSTLISFASSFLVSEGFKNIEFNHVDFSNILVLGEWEISSLSFEGCKSLLCIKDCKQAVITNNKFSHIFTENDLIFISIEKDYMRWFSIVIFDNNQFNYTSSGNNFFSIKSQSESSSIFIKNYEISNSLCSLNIINIEGTGKNIEADIENISIKYSLFDHIINSKETKVLKIASVHTDTLLTQAEPEIAENISYSNNLIRFGLKLYHEPIVSFINASNGDISIWNITINSTTFIDSLTELHFADLRDLDDLSIENIELECFIVTDDFTLSIENSKKSIFSNIHITDCKILAHNILSAHFLNIKLDMNNYNRALLHLRECRNATIDSSYFNSSLISTESQYKDYSFFGVYDTIFVDSNLYLNDSSNFGDYHFIECSFLNASLNNGSVITAYFISENMSILTKKCDFLLNGQYQLYIIGGNYHDIDSSFKENHSVFYAYQKNDNFNSTYSFQAFIFSVNMESYASSFDSCDEYDSYNDESFFDADIDDAIAEVETWEEEIRMMEIEGEDEVSYCQGNWEEELASSLGSSGFN
ncbi:unnamed protein product [Blepharisma stoltei]|uniref:Uncharacterized protein n=1 Tax=Blepharisma stoltei TaxID=1481888 RepID=A0AAU9JAP1_9CILI|nr:unnamed protein product [Blepharisma stoltei]